MNKTVKFVLPSRAFSITMLSLLAVAVAGVSASAQVTFLGLGDFTGGDTSSRAYDVTNGGTVVAGYGVDASGGMAFRWTPGTGLVALGELAGGSYGSNGFKMSDDGTVIVGQSTSALTGSFTEAFRWTQSGGMVGLGDLPGLVVASAAYGLSGDGNVVVGHSPASSGGAFRWTAGTGIQNLGSLATHSAAYGANYDGSVIVGETFFGSSFRWTAAGGLQNIGAGVARATSADGNFVVGGGGNLFYWTPSGGRVSFSATGGTANDTTSSGDVIVGKLNGSGSQAYFWNAAQGVVNLQSYLNSAGATSTGWTLVEAFGVSPDGTAIVGYGLNPAGKEEAFLAVNPAGFGSTVAAAPEPSSAALLIPMGLLGIALSKRRR